MKTSRTSNISNSFTDSAFPVIYFGEHTVLGSNLCARKNFKIRKGNKMQKLFDIESLTSLEKAVSGRKATVLRLNFKNNEHVVCFFPFKEYCQLVFLPSEFYHIIRNESECALLREFISTFGDAGALCYSRLYGEISKKLCAYLDTEFERGTLDETVVDLTRFTKKLFDGIEKNVLPFGCRVEKVWEDESYLAQLDPYSYGASVLASVSAVLRMSCDKRLKLVSKTADGCFKVYISAECRADGKRGADVLGFDRYLAWRTADKSGLGFEAVRRQNNFTIWLTVPERLRGFVKLGAADSTAEDMVLSLLLDD